MLLSITTTQRPATDLGFLLHKHPDRVQRFDVPSGHAHVLYPEATVERCTAALLLDVDPIGLVRGRNRVAPEGFSLGQYVNDRPYVASSLLAVALGRVFRSALKGRCDARPELAAGPLDLELRLPAVPSRGGPELATALFAPLGWAVGAVPLPLDPQVPAWGDSRMVSLSLRGRIRLADALSSLYVLLPVLDDGKHYWVGQDEVDKLLRAGEGWLADHPAADLITRRYLAHRPRLADAAMARLAEVDDALTERLDDAVDTPAEGSPDRFPRAWSPLAELRHDAVLAVLHERGARRVLDLGCGSGALLARLAEDRAFTEVVGVDVSARALAAAGRRLRLDRAPAGDAGRVRLLQGSLTYADERLAGFDAALLVEVVEHLDPSRLPALERVVFERAAPATVVVTTPNAEHNVRYEGLAAGALRHRDHRFEWSRAELRDWAEAAAARRGYAVRLLPVGIDDPEVGPPTQMVVFSR